MKKFTTVDEYILSFTPKEQNILNNIRNIIKEEAPEAVESISYGMPAYKLNASPFVYFAIQKYHIGFYPTPMVITHFKDKLQDYVVSKGAIQFPKTSPIPYSLIEEMVKYRADDLRK